jgi:SnoaL-like domain
MMTTATDLHNLLERDEITTLVARLGVALDDGDFDGLRSLLTDDVTVRTPGGTAEGHEAVIAQASRNHRPDQPCQHLITNVLVDLDGDRATARANLVVAFGPPGGGDRSVRPLDLPVRYTIGEIYHFELRRTPDGWRFARIETTPLWTSGTPGPPPG